MFRHEKVFAMERNCIVGWKPYNINVFSFFIRNFVTPIIESVRTPARIAPYPTGRLFRGGTVPGTSCQATIAPSLRDISQQALARAGTWVVVGPFHFSRGFMLLNARLIRFLRIASIRYSFLNTPHEFA